MMRRTTRSDKVESSECAATGGGGGRDRIGRMLVRKKVKGGRKGGLDDIVYGGGVWEVSVKTGKMIKREMREGDWVCEWEMTNGTRVSVRG